MTSNLSIATMENCKFHGFQHLVFRRRFLNTRYLSMYLSSTLPPNFVLFDTTNGQLSEKNKYTFINISKQYIRIKSKTFLRLLYQKSKVIWDFMIHVRKIFDLSMTRTSDLGISENHAIFRPSVHVKVHFSLENFASKHSPSNGIG